MNKQEQIAVAQRAIRAYRAARTPEEVELDLLIERTVNDGGRLHAIVRLRALIVQLNSEIDKARDHNEVFTKTTAINYLEKAVDLISNQ